MLATAHSVRRPLSASLWLAGFSLSLVALGACPSRTFEDPPSKTEKQETAYYPQSIEKDVDILFVVDNSGSMDPHQTNLRANFPKLIDALRSNKLGGAIPNVHIGVVSTDVGVGTTGQENFGCSIDGDDGKLQHRSADGGCPSSSDGWISYIEGQTNLGGCGGDAVECVKQAFSCVAKLGVAGCGYEAPLESAKRALDPKAGRNPGFLRPDAFLAVVFITDEDDCSAEPALFQDGDKLGPNKSYRCFQHGFQCSAAAGTNPGERTGCKPKEGPLKSISSYIDFFQRLKATPDRLIFAAISGPSDKVVVLPDTDGDAHLEPSCTIEAIDPSTGRPAGGAPALRLNAVVEALGGQTTEICAADFGPALKKLGEKIVASLGGQCIHSPLLLPNGALACAAGAQGCKMPGCGAGESCDVSRGLCTTADGQNTERRCGSTCLDAVDCRVAEKIGAEGQERELAQCPRELFVDAAQRDCGNSCPCWRIVERGEECTKLGASPFGFEVLRVGDAPKGAITVARCRAAAYPWSDARVQEAAQHCSTAAKAGVGQP